MTYIECVVSLLGESSKKDDKLFYKKIACIINFLNGILSKNSEENKAEFYVVENPFYDHLKGVSPKKFSALNEFEVITGVITSKIEFLVPLDVVAVNIEKANLTPRMYMNAVYDTSKREAYKKKNLTITYALKGSKTKGFKESNLYYLYKEIVLLKWNWL